MRQSQISRRGFLAAGTAELISLRSTRAAGSDSLRVVARDWGLPATLAALHCPPNTQQIPDWIRFDLGARYTFDMQDKPVTVRANVMNVANSGYWASANPSYGLSLGMPRTFLLSASMDF